LAYHVTSRHDDKFDVSSVSSQSRSSWRTCRAMLYDKLDKVKMQWLDTSNVSCARRDVTSHVEFGLYWNCSLSTLVFFSSHAVYCLLIARSASETHCSWVRRRSLNSRTHHHIEHMVECTELHQHNGSPSKNKLLTNETVETCGSQRGHTVRYIPYARLTDLVTANNAKCVHMHHRSYQNGGGRHLEFRQSSITLSTDWWIWLKCGKRNPNRNLEAIGK